MDLDTKAARESSQLKTGKIDQITLASFKVWTMTIRGTLGCFLVVSFLTLSCLPQLANATPAEGNALFKIMQQWSADFQGWTAAGDPCSGTANWAGVTCRGGAVVKLNVSNTGINGSLPSEIGDLPSLEVLDISNLFNAKVAKNNILSGPFPDSFAQCTNLKSFNASNINWNIDFPPVLSKLTGLQELYFSNASLTGSIPDDFYNNLQSLRSLILGRNNLEGNLRKTANLKGLVRLALSYNDLTGPIPAELGNLAQLQYLNMTNAGITGSLPSTIGNLRSLQVLDLGNLYNVMTARNNSLSGPFPDSFALCTNLKSFNASNVNWNIDFPPVFSKFTALEELYFSASSLTGTIPDDFFNNLQSLRSLYLGNNDLKGDLQKMAKLKSLVNLAVSQNDFTGTIPAELGNLEKLQYFNCHTCNLYGGLPDSFSNLINLRNLTLHRNNLTGTIPDSWIKMTSMRQFRIDQNYLSGQFPTWMFTDWPQLNFLQVTKNRFSGPAPNITFWDARVNLSYTYIILKWGCNYLNGPQPCTDTYPCSNQTQGLIDDNAYEFERNCYSDASASDLANVEVDCTPYHPSDISCSDFYNLISNGQCVECPAGQVSWPEAGQCVCRLKGSSDKKGVPVGAVVGGVLGLFVAFLVVLGLVLYKRRKHFSWLDIFTVKGRRGKDDWEAPQGVERFTLEDLSKVTHNFSDTNVIGQGGFGKVFVGTLPDGRMVAIKRAPAVPQHDYNEFHNEVTLLSRLHHRNLVKLEGFCDDDGLQILVYEFVKNGNLHAHLLGKLTTTPLHWYRRLEIAYGVAQGLEYLHSFANPPVIHRDVKPSNILLDDNMVARLSDFGISKVNPEHDTHVSTRPAGTAGYLDPDYFMRRQLTTASDVYAFGVVLLELVTGQEAIDHKRLEEFNLIEWVKKRFKTSGIVSVIDPLIENDYNPETYTVLAELGLRCASFDRNQRPNMKVVLAVLEPLMVMQNLYPDIDRQDSKKSQKKVHIAFDTEYLGPDKVGERSLIPPDHTSRSTETNLSEIGMDVEALMSGRLRPR